MPCAPPWTLTHVELKWRNRLTRHSWVIRKWKYLFFYFHVFIYSFLVFIKGFTIGMFQWLALCSREAKDSNHKNISRGTRGKKGGSCVASQLLSRPCASKRRETSRTSPQQRWQPSLQTQRSKKTPAKSAVVASRRDMPGLRWSTTGRSCSDAST